MLKIDAKPVNMNIIICYVPTAQSTEEELEGFYHSLQTALKITQSFHINVFLWDFKAEVDNTPVEEITLYYGLGLRNDGEIALFNFVSRRNIL